VIGDTIPSVGGVLFDAVLLCFGVGALRHAVLLWRQRREVTDREPTPTAEVSPGEQVTVEGRVAPVSRTGDDAPFTSPLRGTRCVLSTWRVEEFFGHEAVMSGGWSAVASGHESVPLRVEDETGSVRVAVPSEQRQFSSEVEIGRTDAGPVVRVGAGESPPASVRRFLADRPELQQRQGETAIPTSERGDEQGDRRYYESVLDVGDEVYVAGYARRSDGAAGDTGRGDEVTLGAPPSGERGSFLLSDASRQSVARRRRFQSAVALAVGLLLVWYGVSQFVPGVPFVRFGL
jgi:hypothetical protein